MTVTVEEFVDILFKYRVSGWYLTTMGNRGIMQCPYIAKFRYAEADYFVGISEQEDIWAESSISLINGERYLSETPLSPDTAKPLIISALKNYTKRNTNYTFITRWFPVLTKLYNITELTK